MIISENQVKIPGRKYTINVHCVATRRLTAIEWLLLTCISRFSSDYEMQGKSLKKTLEEVLRLPDSEILINPALKQLQSLKLIVIASGASFDYETLKYGEIELTGRGTEMLKEGLLPGESTEFPLRVFYNPLTGKFDSHEIPQGAANDVIELGESSDFSGILPRDQLILELQQGNVGGGQFSASQYRIENLEELDSTEVSSYVTFIADVDEKDVLSTKPEIDNERVRRRIEKLFTTKEITSSFTETLPDISEIKTKTVLGSGRKMSEAFLDICSKGRILFLDSRVYSLFSRRSELFDGKIVILFNADDFAIDMRHGTKISIPEPFSIEGTVAVNEKNNSISLAKATYEYFGNPVTVPLAVQDKRLTAKKDVALKWLDHVIDNQNENGAYYALYTLPFWSYSSEDIAGCLREKWMNKSIDEIAYEARTISECCKKLNTDATFLASIGDLYLARITACAYNAGVKALKDLVEAGCVVLGSTLHVKLVKELLKVAAAPKSIVELHQLLKDLSITDHETALAFDDAINPLYTTEIIRDVIGEISAGKYQQIDELFELDIFFNEYSADLSQIELLVTGFKAFEKTDEAVIAKSIVNCPNIALLQTNLADVLGKNAELINRGLNINEVLSSINHELSEAYFSNLRIIEKYTAENIDSLIMKIQEIKSLENGRAEESSGNESALAEEKKEEAQYIDRSKTKVYVFDTCALLNRPDVMLYCEENAYIRIPSRVVQELDKIKDGRSEKYGDSNKVNARQLLNEFKSVYSAYCNSENNPVAFVVDQAKLDLLPEEYERSKPDNQIISVALFYKEWDVAMITDDKGMMAVALAFNLKTIASSDFIKQNNEFFCSTLDLKKKYSSEGKTLPIIEAGKQPEAEKKNAQTQSIDMILSSMSVMQMKNFIPILNDKCLNYLKSKGIKTAGDFCRLTPEKLSSFSGNSKEMILHNSISSALPKVPEAIALIKEKYHIKE